MQIKSRRYHTSRAEEDQPKPSPVEGSFCGPMLHREHKGLHNLMKERADDQQQIFNPDCRNATLLSYIRIRCCANSKVSDLVELSDERGVVKNLRQFPQEYAKAYVRDREILVLLKVDNVESSTSFSSSKPGHVGRVTYTPLLTNLRENSDFMETLNPPREDESLSDVSSKSSRRRSSTLDIDELKTNSARAKSKTNGQSVAKKPTAKSKHRPPLRKTTTAS
ncbi:hypothetical protein EGW08_004396 [Elysia chlorotica]|uniref:Uncharacterized protein n=1 Tax=Elysia chlorotica TaxID=188477 RepID=A0A3S1BGL3_ELYCH|nr:hypothetical protein EGW08_004396 [Elysia chlorotica]